MSPVSARKPSYSTRSIYVAGFFPLSKTIEEGGIGRGVIPAVQLAMEHINNNTNILRNHKLVMKIQETKVSYQDF